MKFLIYLEKLMHLITKMTLIQDILKMKLKQKNYHYSRKNQDY